MDRLSNNDEIDFEILFNHPFMQIAKLDYENYYRENGYMVLQPNNVFGEQ